MQDIAKFVDGFRRFQKRYFSAADSLYADLRRGQRPSALVIACSDSRVDPALLTDCAPGDMFVVRNVANLVPPCETDAAHHGVSAAVEYAVTSLRVAHVIVLGHSSCGGIHALLSDAEPEGRFIAPWVAIARPARDRVLRELPDAAPEVRARACEMAAISVSLDNLRTFPCVEKRLADDRLRLHGWYFDMDAGELLALDPETGAFAPLAPRLPTPPAPRK